MTNNTQNIILDKTFKLGLNVIKLSDELESKRKYVFADQILRCGTSIGANMKESQGAASRKDFINKCRIAYKETEELEYFLLLCKHSENYPTPDLLLSDAIEIKKILNKIIATSISNKN